MRVSRLLLDALDARRAVAGDVARRRSADAASPPACSIARRSWATCGAHAPPRRSGRRRRAKGRRRGRARALFARRGAAFDGRRQRLRLLQEAHDGAVGVSDAELEPRRVAAGGRGLEGPVDAPARFADDLRDVDLLLPGAAAVVDGLVGERGRVVCQPAPQRLDPLHHRGGHHRHPRRGPREPHHEGLRDLEARHVEEDAPARVVQVPHADALQHEPPDGRADEPEEARRRRAVHRVGLGEPAAVASAVEDGMPRTHRVRHLLPSWQRTGRRATGRSTAPPPGPRSPGAATRPALPPPPSRPAGGRREGREDGAEPRARMKSTRSRPPRAAGPRRRSSGSSGSTRPARTRRTRCPARRRRAASRRGPGRPRAPPATPRRPGGRASREGLREGV